MVRVKPYRPVKMFIRYVDDPQKTEACFSGDFYVTGDLGRRDKDGHFWIVGRADDLINVNRLLINICDVEKSLRGHPAVLDCAVVSSLNQLSQTILKAFIVLSSDFKNKNQDELMKELQEYMQYNAAAWMCPEKIEFIDDLPRNLSGKVVRRQLRDKEWNIQ